jgi:hypothetical protein
VRLAANPAVRARLHTWAEVPVATAHKSGRALDMRRHTLEQGPAVAPHLTVARGNAAMVY